MIWFTWRQFRAQTVIAAGGLAAFGVLLLVTGRSITDLYADVAACHERLRQRRSTPSSPRFRSSAAGTGLPRRARRCCTCCPP